MEYFHQLRTMQEVTFLISASSSPPENWSSFDSNNLSSIANSLNTHFISVSSSTFSPNPDHLPPPTLSPPHSTPTLSLCPATPEWCEKALAAIKPNCTTGPDHLPSAALIAGRTVISYPLCSIINSSIAHSLFPTAWKCVIVKPLHKGKLPSHLSSPSSPLSPREASSYPAITTSPHPQPTLPSSVWIPPFPLNPNSSHTLP